MVLTIGLSCGRRAIDELSVCRQYAQHVDQNHPHTSQAFDRSWASACGRNWPARSRLNLAAGTCRWRNLFVELWEIYDKQASKAKL